MNSKFFMLLLLVLMFLGLGGCSTSRNPSGQSNLTDSATQNPSWYESLPRWEENTAIQADIIHQSMHAVFLNLKTNPYFAGAIIDSTLLNMTGSEGSLGTFGGDNKVRHFFEIAEMFFTKVQSGVTLSRKESTAFEIIQRSAREWQSRVSVGISPTSVSGTASSSLTLSDSLAEHEANSVAVLNEVSVLLPADVLASLRKQLRDSYAAARDALIESGYRRLMNPNDLIGTWRAPYLQVSTVDITFAPEEQLPHVVLNLVDPDEVPYWGVANWAGNGTWSLNLRNQLTAKTTAVGRAGWPGSKKHRMSWAYLDEIESITNSSIVFKSGETWRKIND